MPIKGTTDREGGIADGMIRIGTLFKGEEQRERTKKNGQTVMIMGRDLSYFRMDFEPEYEHLRPEWEALYGKEPEMFEPVFLAAQSVEEILDSCKRWMEDWNGSGILLHRCDGETQVKHWQQGADMYSTAKIACASDGRVPCKCKETARLTLILPRLWEALGIPCVVTLTTHSKYDIIALRGHLALIQKMYGTIAGVPFVFGRSMREVSVPNEKEPGKRIKTNKSLLYIRVTSNFTLNHLLPALSSAPAALPAGSADDDFDRLDVGEARAVLGSGEPASDETKAIISAKASAMGAMESRRI